MKVSPFGIIDDSTVDKIQHEAVMGWVFDKVTHDIATQRSNIVCLMYGIAFTSVGANGEKRIFLASHSGGYNGVKGQLAVHMLQNLSISDKKGGTDESVRFMTWRWRVAFYIMNWLTAGKDVTR